MQGHGKEVAGKYVCTYNTCTSINHVYVYHVTSVDQRTNGRSRADGGIILIGTLIMHLLHLFLPYALIADLLFVFVLFFCFLLLAWYNYAMHGVGTDQPR